MKRYGTLTLAALLAAALDTAVFSLHNFAGVRPFLMLAVALAACVRLNVQSGIVIAFFGGLLLDAVCNTYLGLTAGCWLVSVSVFYLLTRRNQPKALLLWLFSALAAWVSAPIEWLYAFIGGAGYGGLLRILTVALPSAVLTGLCVLPLSALLRWAKKGHRDRI